MADAPPDINSFAAKVIALRRAYDELRRRQATLARKFPAAFAVAVRRAYEATGPTPPAAPRHLKGMLGGRLPDWAIKAAAYQLQDRDVRKEEFYYLIDRCITERKKLGGKVDEEIVPEVAKAIGCHPKTVYNALHFMEERREAEAAHTKTIEDQLTATKHDPLQ